MDLKKFIETNIELGYISSVLGGIENSAFYPENIDISQFIKHLLDKSDADKQQIYSQLQSGGISETQLNAGVIKKKLSFCTDFPIIVNNIIALLGFDFAKHLICLFTLPKRLKSLIDEFPRLKSYEECKLYIRYIYNIVSLKNEGDESVFDISDSFKPVKMTAFEDDSVLNYDSHIGKLKFLDDILSKIDTLISHKNLVLLNKDKQEWHKILLNMMDNITINDYEIKNVDDLCVYINDFDVGYKGSFIKQFNMLYRENYSEISPDILSEEYIEKHKPHIDYLNEINFENYNAYLSSFNRYFKNVYKLCYKTLFPKNDSVNNGDETGDDAESDGENGDKDGDEKSNKKVDDKSGDDKSDDKSDDEKDSNSTDDENKDTEKDDKKSDSKTSKDKKNNKVDSSTKMDNGECTKEELMNINIMQEFYDQLTQITLNLFIRITKNIAASQSIQSYFGKSNRVQFIQIMSAIMSCQPRAEDFTESQREAIHYYLLTSKLLNDSYSMLSKYSS